jgi:hypothetical protein
MTAIDKFGIKKFYKTKSGSTNYYANWNSTRTISSNGEDTVDPRLQVTCNATPLKIGGGIAQWDDQSSARMYVNNGGLNTQWLNTEQTIYCKVDEGSSTTSIQLRNRSNHHGADDGPYSKVGDVSCGFAGYNIVWGKTSGTGLTDDVEISIEYVHGMYKRHVLDVDQVPTIPYGKWFGLKSIIRNTDEENIVLTGYINVNVNSQKNWRKAIEFTFNATETASDLSQSTYDFENTGGGGADRVPICLTGTPAGDGIVQNTLQGMIDKKIFNQPAYWTWVRIEDADGVDMKYYSVREILPNSPFN